MSLTTCLKKAGAHLHPDDKAAILATARSYRASGMTGDDAGRRAIKDRLAEISHPDFLTKQAAQVAPEPALGPAKPEAAPQTTQSRAADARAIGEKAFKDGAARAAPEAFTKAEKLAWLAGWDEANPAVTVTETKQRDTSKASVAGKRAMMVNPERDTLLEALAKMGGVTRESAAKHLGVHKDNFGHWVRFDGNMKGYPFRATGGMNADAAREALVEHGYLHGVPEEDQMRALEEQIGNELGGSPHYSITGEMRNAAEAHAEHGREQEEASREPPALTEEEAARLHSLADEAGITDDELSRWRDDWEAAHEAQFDDHGTEAEGHADTAPKAGGDADGQAAGTGAPRGEKARPGVSAGPEEGLTLEAQTPADLKAKAEREAAAAAAEKAKQKAIDDKAKADGERDGFTLTGSDRPADIAAAQGQGDIFAAPPPKVEGATKGPAKAIEDEAGNVALASRGTAATGMDPAALRKQVATITRNWKGGPKAINVVSSDAIPAGLRSADPEGLVRGWYDPETKEVNLVHDRLSSPAQAQFVLFHESYGHLGMRAFLGDEYASTMMRMRRNNAGVSSQAAMWTAEHGNAQIAADMKNGMSRQQAEVNLRLVATEEALSDRAGEAPSRSTMQFLIARLQRGLRAIGLDKVADWLENRTDAEVLDLLASARKAVQEGTSRAGEGLALASRANDPESDALHALSQVDDLYALKRSSAMTIEGIAHDTAKNLKVKVLHAGGITAGYTVTFPSGSIATISVRDPNPFGFHQYGFAKDDSEVTHSMGIRPGEDARASDYDKGDVYINVAELKGQGEGQVVYHIAANYAHNTGRIFIGDPNGVSEDATRRRTEAMLSSALKFGTTDHLAPHPRQVAGNEHEGVPPLRWVYGDHLGNIRRMIDVNREAIQNAGADLVTYDPASGRFLDSEGQEISRAGINALASLPAAVAARAGGRTIARSAWLDALARGESSEAGSGDGRPSGLLARILRERAVHGSASVELFSRREDTAGAGVHGLSESGRPGPGVVASRSLAGVLNDAGDIRLPAGYIVNDFMRSTPGKVSWWDRTVGTMYNVAEKNPTTFKPVFDELQNFVNDTGKYANEHADLAPSLIPRLNRFGDVLKQPVSAEDTRALAAPVFEGTLIWTRDADGKLVKLEDERAAADGTPTAQKAARLLRDGGVTEAELRRWQATPLSGIYDGAIGNRFNERYMHAGVVFSDAELREHFKLNDRQIGQYHEFRDTTDASLADLAKSEMLRLAGQDAPPSVRAALMKAKSASDAATLLRGELHAEAERNPSRAKVLNGVAEKIGEITDRTTSLQQRGYAPLSRFGPLTLDVLAKDGDRLYFGLFENDHERSRMARMLKNANPEATVTQGTVSQEEYRLMAGVDPDTIALFGDILGLDQTGDKASDVVFQQWIKNAVSTRSTLQRLVHRKGIAGFSEDAARVLAGFVTSNARRLSSNLHMNAIDEHTTAIPQGQGELKDLAVKLGQYVKQPQEEAHQLRSLLFAQYLGGSVASALVNSTQPFLVSMPYLSQFGGIAKAGAQMLRASKDAVTFAKTKTTGDAALDAAMKEHVNVISTQEIHQMQAQARGSAVLISGDGTKAGDAYAAAANAMSRLHFAWGKVFSVAEQFNRRSTFIAAYRMAVERGEADPGAFAANAVNQTQFVYGKHNRPQWARGAVGGTLFTFKSFTISYLELLGRMWNTGAPGSPERAAGRKATLLALGVLMLASGADGLPFEDNIDDLVDGFMQRVMGVNFSLKRQRHELLQHAFGDDIGRAMEKGLTGIPGVPIDVSGRLGMNRVIPGTGLLVKKQDYTSDLTGLLGPAGDLAKRALQGAAFAAQGDFGAASKIVQPQAVRNLMTGWDALMTGIYHDAAGKAVLPVSALEAAGKMIGFQPQTIARIQEASGQMIQEKQLVLIVKGELQAKYAQALVGNDQDGMAAVRKALVEWNAANPEVPIALNRAAIAKQARELRETKAERLAATAPKAMRQRVREELAAASQ